MRDDWPFKLLFLFASFRINILERFLNNNLLIGDYKINVDKESSVSLLAIAGRHELPT